MYMQTIRGIIVRRARNVEAQRPEFNHANTIFTICHAHIQLHRHTPKLGQIRPHNMGVELKLGTTTPVGADVQAPQPDGPNFLNVNYREPKQ